VHGTEKQSCLLPRNIEHKIQPTECSRQLDQLKEEEKEEE
jgi:hypothetical protein